MEKIFSIATNIAAPLALSGFSSAAFFLILKELIKEKNIFPVLAKKNASEIIKLIIVSSFILSLVAMILGFVGYIFPKNNQILGNSLSGEKVMYTSPKHENNMVNKMKTLKDKLAKLESKKELGKNVNEQIILVREQYISAITTYKNSLTFNDNDIQIFEELINWLEEKLAKEKEELFYNKHFKPLENKCNKLKEAYYIYDMKSDKIYIDFIATYEAIINALKRQDPNKYKNLIIEYEKEKNRFVYKLEKWTNNQEARKKDAKKLEEPNTNIEDKVNILINIERI
ncbi:hypothetical protein GMMP15_390035 [Candidatus Magnetomoraceae bacterium gMMP-15]